MAPWVLQRPVSLHCRNFGNLIYFLVVMRRWFDLCKEPGSRGKKGLDPPNPFPWELDLESTVGRILGAGRGT